MSYRTIVSVAALLWIVQLAEPALAIVQFQKEFVNLYVGDDKESEWALHVKEAKCFVCHQGKSRKHRNAYGEQLDLLLDKKADAKNPEKIIEALKTVAALHTIAGDDSSPTFGDLIKEGKLPGGTLEDSKKEVEGEADEEHHDDHEAE